MGLCIHSRHFWLERPTVRHYAETENVNWRFPTGSSLWDQGTPWKKGERTPGEHCPMNELRRAHIGSQRLKRQAWGHHRLSPGSLCICWDVTLVFCENLNSENECIFDIFTSSCKYFPPFGLSYPTLIWGCLPCYCILFHLVWLLSLKDFSFLKRK